MGGFGFFVCFSAYQRLRRGSRRETTIGATILPQSMSSSVRCGNLLNSTLARNHVPFFFYLFFFPACFFQPYSYNPPTPHITTPLTSFYSGHRLIHRTDWSEMQPSKHLLLCGSYCFCSEFKTPECKLKISKIVIDKLLTEK